MNSHLALKKVLLLCCAGCMPELPVFVANALKIIKMGKSKYFVGYTIVSAHTTYVTFQIEFH
jgi:hypothetical protein